jgi:NTP pyrophosphatase (non-canonical NTP hydrolase)
LLPEEDSGLHQLVSEIIAFRDRRNWAQYHNPKDLAISLCLEASELLENFQWRTSDEAVAERPAQIRGELADVLIYALLLGHSLGLDPEATVREKLSEAERKYPAGKAYGSRKKYTELERED